MVSLSDYGEREVAACRSVLLSSAALTKKRPNSSTSSALVSGRVSGAYRPPRVLGGFEDRMELVDVAHGEFGEDEALGSFDDAFDVLIDLIFGIMLFRIGRHRGAFAKQDAGLRSRRFGNEFIGHEAEAVHNVPIDSDEFIVLG